MYKKEWKFAIMSFKIAANIKIMMLSALESKKKIKSICILGRIDIFISKNNANFFIFFL